MSAVGVLKHAIGDPPLWPDRPEGVTSVVHIDDVSSLVEFAVVEGGMQSGLSSVAIHAVSTEGVEVVIEVSLRMLTTAAAALVAMAETWGEKQP